MKKKKAFFVNCFSKINNLYRKANRKNPYVEPIIVITSSLALVLIIILSLNGTSLSQSTSISDNIAEEYYYNGNYDSAISEYNLLQENEEWPISLVKTAEIYSLRGEFDKSNDLLSKAVKKRDDIINANGRELYIDKDIELMNCVVFTYFINGEYEQATSLGEDYILRYGNNQDILKILFTIYSIDEDTENMNKVLKEYTVNNQSAYDLSLFAEMNFVANEWDKGLELLNEAWLVNKDEIKIMEVIEDYSLSDKNTIISKLTNLVEENPQEVGYKLFLAKVYSLYDDTVGESDEILSDISNEDIGYINVELIKASNDFKSGKKDEAKSIIENIINNDNEKFYAKYVEASSLLQNKDFKNAFEVSKNSILESKIYANNYIRLIPRILEQDGKIIESYPYLRTGLKLEPFNFKAYFTIGDTYAKAKDYKNAEKYYKLGLKLEKSSSDYYYKLAKIYLDDDNIESAIEVMKNLVELDKDNIDYLRSLGAMYIKDGDGDLGISNIRAAYEIDSNDSLVLNNAAVYYFTLGNDFERGMVNMESAYQNSENIQDLDIKKELLSNYNLAKQAYDRYSSSDNLSIEIPELTLFY